MKMLNIAKIAVATALVLAPLPGAAQSSRVLRVPCCKCVDGKKLEVAIDTGRVTGWTVRKPGSGPMPVQSASNAAWASVSPASWVGPGASVTAAGEYVYELTFTVPECVIPAGVSISGRFAADNSATLFIDGNQVASTSGGIYGFQAGGIAPYTITGLSPGQHTLTVEVNNAGNVTGLALSGVITVACPRDPRAIASASGQLSAISDSCSDCSAS
ncbi:MAG: hypothetical protein ACOY4K_15910 [Pseudomonadota bacterium]